MAAFFPNQTPHNVLSESSVFSKNKEKKGIGKHTHARTHIKHARCGISSGYALFAKVPVCKYPQLNGFGENILFVTSYIVRKSRTCITWVVRLCEIIHEL